MINLKTEQLRLSIKDMISSSELPISNIYYIIKDIYSDIAILYNKVLEDEIKQLETKKEEDEKEEV